MINYFIFSTDAIKGDLFYFCDYDCAMAWVKARLVMWIT